MNLQIFIALAATCIFPTLVTIHLSKRESLFEKPVVKGFGLGVYTALIFLLFSESLEHSDASQTFFWAGIGLAISLIIGIVFKEFHHHHNHEEKAERHTRSSTWRILLSDFFHNIVDGIAVVSGFGISPIIGFTSFIGVLGHQTIQQTGQQVLLVESGVKSKKAIFVSLLISLSIFLGLVLKQYESLEAILIALSAGIIAWKVGTDIMHAKWQQKTVFGFFIGVTLLTISLLLVPHGH